MKLPEERHPRLFGLFLIPAVVLVTLAVLRSDTPFAYPVDLVALLAGLLQGAMLVLAYGLTEVAGGEQYLRDQLTRRRRGMRPYWWAVVLAWAQFCTVMWLVQEIDGHAVLWYWCGVSWGILIVGYPLARAHWKRLESMIAAERAQAVSA